MIVLESQIFTFNTNIILAVYNQEQVPQDEVALAPLTGVYPNPIYLPGTILAQYGANSPSPQVYGQFVNYSAASSNADQAIPVALLIDQDVANGVGTAGGACQVGVAGNTVALYRIIWLQSPAILSGIALVNANEAADITAFLAATPHFAPPVGSVSMYQNNGQQDQAYVLK